MKLQKNIQKFKYPHTYPYDYRASEFNWNNEWNPTTLLLDSLSSVGLVWNKKVGSPI